MASRADVDLYRQLIMDLWRRSFDLGGPHWSRTVRDEGTVDHIAAQIAEGVRAGELPSLVAGRALHQVVSFHPFGDCNHRTGWFVCETLMAKAGVVRRATADDVVRFVRSIDSSGLEEADVVGWVRMAFRRR